MPRDIKVKKSFMPPDNKAFEDTSVQKYAELLGRILIQSFKDIYDDIQSLQTVEKVTALPTASINWRGKFVFVDGSGSADDVLHYCILNSADAYEWKTVGLS